MNKKGEIVKTSFDKIIDRMNVNAEYNCVITIKDHNENFLNQPKMCLINSAKYLFWRKSKTILDNINKLFDATKIKQWENTVSAVKWFNPHMHEIFLQLSSKKWVTGVSKRKYSIN